jgi:hypothetical protein
MPEWILKRHIEALRPWPGFRRWPGAYRGPGRVPERKSNNRKLKIKIDNIMNKSTYETSSLDDVLGG